MFNTELNCIISLFISSSLKTASFSNLLASDSTGTDETVFRLFNPDGLSARTHSGGAPMVADVAK
nr:hypothetical protein [Serratia fonticola]